MFSKIATGLKNLGKKAIGYIRGLNGDKAAAWATKALFSYSPMYGAAAAPFLNQLGKYINEKMDRISDRSGGVLKPALPYKERKELREELAKRNYEYA